MADANACCPECGSGVAWKPEAELFLCFMCGLLFPADLMVTCNSERPDPEQGTVARMQHGEAG